MDTRIKSVAYSLRRVLRPIFVHTKDLWLWKAGLRKGPPPFVKQKWVRHFQRNFDATIFVESGTYLGDMVCAVKKQFAEIYSIELDAYLAEKARRRFRKYSHVHIIHGDSSDVLPDLLKNLSGRRLIWLDAHFSGGITARGNMTTPIVGELVAVGANYRRGDVLLIDDFGSFTGRDDYPDFDSLKTILHGIDPLLRTEIIDDIVCVFDAESRTTLS